MFPSEAKDVFDWKINFMKFMKDRVETEFVWSYKGLKRSISSVVLVRFFLLLFVFFSFYIGFGFIVAPLSECCQLGVDAVWTSMLYGMESLDSRISSKLSCSRRE